MYAIGSHIEDLTFEREEEVFLLPYCLTGRERAALNRHQLFF